MVDFLMQSRYKLKLYIMRRAKIIVPYELLREKC